MKKRFYISGMTCSNCANHIDSAVRKLNINDCNVNLLLNQMEVDYDEEYINDNDIIQVVSDAGYVASTKKITNNKSSNISLITSIFLLIILFIFVMFLRNDYSVFLQPILAIIILIIHSKRLINGIKTLFSFNFTMDTLISLGAFSSYLYSLYLLFNGEKMLYFDASAMVVTFVSIGKFLEERSKSKTCDTLENLIQLAPNKAIRLVNGKQEKIDVNNICIGDLLLVKPGQKIPTDGICISGHSYIDTSSLTGESLPKEVNENDEVVSGYINLNNPITIKSTKRYEDSTFAKIIDLVMQAANSKASISVFADKISKIFVPLIIVIAIFTALIWYLISHNPTKAFIHFVNCLVVSCPCSLGLATPTAIMVATGVGAKNGIIFKEAKYIEQLSQTNTIIFDKTGTLTYGLHQVISCNIKDEDVIYKMECLNDHPLAKTICAYLKNRVNNDVEISNYHYLIGLGIECDYQNNHYLIGNEKLMHKYHIQFNLEENNYTTLYCAKNNEYLGYISLQDRIKNDASFIINYLSSKYKIFLLSGDSLSNCNAVAHTLGINNVKAEVLPQEKYEFIKEVQKNANVCMVGDGINDTIALTQANVGIAMSNSSDIAFQASDIILTNNTLSALVNALNLSKFTMKIIKENLLWALGYNSVLIPIAIGLFSSFNIDLKPAYCAIAMSLSSITVVCNSLRINCFKPIAIPKNDTSNSYKIMIDTMTCIHCVNAVSNVLLNLNIISKCDLKDSSCIINIDYLDENKIKQEIEKAGYKVKSITKI